MSRDYSNSEIIDSIELVIPDDARGTRLDKYLGLLDSLKLSRSKIQKLIKEGLVTVDGSPAEHSHVLEGGERIVIQVAAAPPSDAKPEEIALDIRYEDETVIVVNKPSGMVTHPAAGNYTGTLVNALLHYTSKLSNLYGTERPGIVHRLDKETSGLIIVARTEAAHVFLQEELQKRNIKRTYRALVCGHVKEKEGEISLPIGRSLKDRKKMTVTHVKSRESITEYKLIDRYRLYDLLEVNLQTGRTHQIRVHFSHLGHPAFGDPDYGGRQKWHKGVYGYDKQIAQKGLEIMNRQALHAIKLVFPHPVTKEKITVESELPEDFRRLLEFLDSEGR